MSSILEALRELESDRPRPPGQTTVAGAPAAPPRRSDAWIPLVGGLAVGIVVFGAAVWSAGIFSSTPSAPAAPQGRAAAEPPQAATAATVPERPAWLDSAEAPRARVGAAAPVPAPPEAPAPLPAERPAASVPPPPPSTPSPPRHAETAAASSGQVDVLSVAYSPSIDRRTATLRVNGRPVTLHQRESAGGVEVQLIMKDGVYLRRGADVYFATPLR